MSDAAKAAMGAPPVLARWPVRTTVAALALLLSATHSAVTWAVEGTPGTVPFWHSGSEFIQPVAVFGADDRIRLPERMRALEEKIGLLYEPATRSVCTAFCVGEATVATAAHCFYRTRGQEPVPLANVTFRLASAKKRAPGVKIAGADNGAAAQNILTGTTSLSTTPPIDATKDWAIVRLQSPVCRSGALPLANRLPAELSPAEDARPIYQVGYHGDFGNWRLTLSPPCTVRRLGQKVKGHIIGGDFANAAALILHTCDTGGASSGSPLLADGPQGPEVVGINVGTYLQSEVLMQSGEVLHRYRSDTIANTGVSTVAFLDQTNQFARVEILSSHAAIRRLQTALAAVGFYRGPTDGRYSQALRLAIEAFEAAEQRPRTGIASTEILRRLDSAIAATMPEFEPETVETGSVPSVQSPMP